MAIYIQIIVCSFKDVTFQRAGLFAKGAAHRWIGLIFSPGDIGKHLEIKVHVGLNAAMT